MDREDLNVTRRRGPWVAVVIAAAAGALGIALPATSNADPEPAPPPATTAAPAPSPAPAPAPGDPNTAPLAADPNAPPPPPVAEQPRITNAVGGFSFLLPPGWVESDSSHLDYGSAMLSKTTGEPPAPGQAPAVANDTRIVLGRLDQKLYASAEPDNAKAAVRLGSDMGEFYMPYPGTRINQETVPLSGNGLQGSASYYEVKFNDTAKPNGQIWTGVLGAPATDGGPPQRWFVVWLGTSNDPVDKGAAKALAESIQPWAPPPAAPGAPAPGPAPVPASPAPAPVPGAPAPGGASAPGGQAPEVPTPVPAPGQAPAAQVTPPSVPATPPTLRA